MKMMHAYVARITIVAALFLACVAVPVGAQTFDFDTGIAPIEVVIPHAIPAIFSVSPDASDASLVLRMTTLITNGWFDAIAPYHPTAVGVYSRLGRRPAAEASTNRNKNTAIMYASYRVLNSLFPQHVAGWRGMMLSVGLDPDAAQTDTTTAIGIGNAAGNAVVAARERDGMNQLGDEGGRQYNRRPYADYTEYQPVNTPYELHDPSRWQPNIVTRGTGIFQAQSFVTPQWKDTTPYSYDVPDRFSAPPPTRSNHRNRTAYTTQADEVLAISAGLTDYQKAAAEFFNNKIRSIGLSALFIAQTRGFTLDQFVHFDFLVNLAAFDSGIAVWNAKYLYDAVRPFTAIRYLYGGHFVTAWAGPGQGTVHDLRGAEWRSYLNTADHPEYPSGSACFCAAHSQAARRFLGSDNFGWSVPVPQGASDIEPGITPAADVVLGPWPNWSDFEQECGLSRLWAGVHFPASIPAGQNLCRPVGDLAYEFVQRHIAGTVH
jgi:hypothetical protein